MKEKTMERDAALRHFYRELRRVTDNGMEVIYRMLAVIYTFVVVTLVAFPPDRNLLVLLLNQVFAVELYLLRYLTVREDGKLKRVAEKLRYLPVDRRAVRLLPLAALGRFLAVPAAAGWAAHLLAAFLGGGTVGWWDVCYPILAAWVYPFAAGALLCLADSRP